MHQYRQTGGPVFVAESAMKYDIIIVGAGPAGLSFARSFKETVENDRILN